MANPSPTSLPLTVDTIQPKNSGDKDRVIKSSRKQPTSPCEQSE